MKNKIILLLLMAILLTGCTNKNKTDKEANEYRMINSVTNIEFAIPERIYSDNAVYKYDYLEKMIRDSDGEISYRNPKEPEDIHIYNSSVAFYSYTDCENFFISVITDINTGKDIKYLNDIEIFNDTFENANMESIKKISTEEIPVLNKEKTKLVANISFLYSGAFNQKYIESDFIDKEMQGKLVILQHGEKQSILVIGNCSEIDELDKDLILTTTEIKNIINSFSFTGNSSSLIKQIFSGELSTESKVIGTDIVIRLNNLNLPKEYENKIILNKGKYKDILSCVNNETIMGAEYVFPWEKKWEFAQIEYGAIGCYLGIADASSWILGNSLTRPYNLDYHYVEEYDEGEIVFNLAALQFDNLSSDINNENFINPLKTIIERLNLSNEISTTRLLRKNSYDGLISTTILEKNEIEVNNRKWVRVILDDEMKDTNELGSIQRCLYVTIKDNTMIVFQIYNGDSVTDNIIDFSEELIRNVEIYKSDEICEKGYMGITGNYCYRQEDKYYTEFEKIMNENTYDMNW